MRLKRILVAAIAGFAIAASTGVALGGDGALSPQLQEVRAAVARYHSIQQALNDGYVFEADEPCVTSPPAPSLDGSQGTMGIHVPNPALLADQALDPLRPELLLYVRKANGELEFVGVEYFRVALANTPSGPAPWFAATAPPLGFATPAPSLFGQTFQGPMPGHNPQMPWHYDLHAWVAEANPSGANAMFNPAISC